MRALSLLPIGAALAATSIAAQTPAPSPCTKAIAACERWITFGGGPARSMVYATYALDEANPASRARSSWCTAPAATPITTSRRRTAAGFLAGALDNTIIIAPRFIAGQRQAVAPNEIMWPEGGNSWRSGGMSPTNPTISSFDFVDEIVRKLADKKTFPNLTKIVVAGHSAGGQFATRYEMANKVHGTPGVDDQLRRRQSVELRMARRRAPAADRRRRSRDRRQGSARRRTARRCTRTFSYGPFDATKAPNYNRWPAGLENRTGYTAGPSSDDQLKQAARRAPDDVSARPGGRAAARRVRLVAERDGAGPDAPRPRRGVLQVRHRDARREAQRDHRSGVRAQRSLHLHDRTSCSRRSFRSARASALVP